MSLKTIIFICSILIFAMPYSSNSKTQSITVLVKVECKGSGCGWSSSYQYNDRRKEVFEQNTPLHKEPKLNPDPTPNPMARGYTKFEGYNYPELSIITPESTMLKYNKTGKLEKEEWDTDSDQVMDRYYLYHYNKKNKLFKRDVFYSDRNESFTDLYRRYRKNGQLKKEVRYSSKFLFEADYYNSKGQLIKTESINKKKSYYDSYILYKYKSGFLIKAEKHQYGKVFTEHYKYDKSGRIIEHTDEDRSLKYQYDKDGKLIRKDELHKYPKITYFYYDKGLLVRSETDFDNDGTINIVQYFYYDKNGNLIRDEWDRNDGKIENQTIFFYETINLN